MRDDFEEIQRLGIESGILKGTARFEDYADASFVEDEATIQPLQLGGRKMSSLDSPVGFAAPRVRALWSGAILLPTVVGLAFLLIWDLAVGVTGSTLFPKPFDVALGILGNP